jgi:hypothetical protein
MMLTLTNGLELPKIRLGSNSFKHSRNFTLPYVIITLYLGFATSQSFRDINYFLIDSIHLYFNSTTIFFATRPLSLLFRLCGTFKLSENLSSFVVFFCHSYSFLLLTFITFPAALLVCLPVFCATPTCTTVQIFVLIDL